MQGLIDMVRREEIPAGSRCSMRISAACRRSTPILFFIGTASRLPLSGSKRSWEKSCQNRSQSADAVSVATRILDASAARKPIPPITDSDTEFDLAQAYAVSAEITSRRSTRGEHRVGWKIGFTNSAIWKEQGLNAPIWGPMYDKTVAPVGSNGSASSHSIACLNPASSRRSVSASRAYQAPKWRNPTLSAASTPLRTASRSFNRSIPAGSSSLPTRSRPSACTADTATESSFRSRAVGEGEMDRDASQLHGHSLA